MGVEDVECMGMGGGGGGEGMNPPNQGGREVEVGVAGGGTGGVRVIACTHSPPACAPMPLGVRVPRVAVRALLGVPLAHVQSAVEVGLGGH